MAAAGRAIAQVVRLHAPLIKFPNRLSDPTPYVPLTRLPGTPDTAATIRDLPQRYRRRIVAPEEMEYIQRGGPE